MSVKQEDVVERALELERHGYESAAIDLIHDFFDENFRAGHFAYCDSFLFRTDPSKLTDNILISILTATLPATSKLSVRANFWVRCMGVAKSDTYETINRLEGNRTV